MDPSLPSLPFSSVVESSPRPPSCPIHQLAERHFQCCSFVFDAMQMTRSFSDIVSRLSSKDYRFVVLRVLSHLRHLEWPTLMENRWVRRRPSMGDDYSSCSFSLCFSFVRSRSYAAIPRSGCNLTSFPSLGVFELLSCLCRCSLLRTVTQTPVQVSSSSLGCSPASLQSSLV